MKYKLCVWDLDGTLLNTLVTLNYYDNETLKHYGYNPINIEQSADIIKLPIQSYYSKLLEYGGCKDIEKVVNQVMNYELNLYINNPTYLTAPFDNIKEALKKLKNLGIKNIVLSNKPNDVAVKLVKHFFSEEIEKTYGQTKDTISKPKKGSINVISKDYNISPDEMIIIGDTEVDILTAKNHNIDSIAVKWGYSDLNYIKSFNPTYVINDPIEIIDIVKEK